MVTYVYSYLFASNKLNINYSGWISKSDVSSVLLPAALLDSQSVPFDIIVAPSGWLISLAGGVSSRRALRPRQPREYVELLALLRSRFFARRRVRVGTQCAGLARPHLDGRLYGAHQQHRAAALIERRKCLRAKFMSWNLDTLVRLLRLGGRCHDRQRVLGAQVTAALCEIRRWRFPGNMIFDDEVFGARRDSRVREMQYFLLVLTSFPFFLLFSPFPSFPLFCLPLLFLPQPSLLSVFPLLPNIHGDVLLIGNFYRFVLFTTSLGFLRTTSGAYRFSMRHGWYTGGRRLVALLTLLLCYMPQELFRRFTQNAFGTFFLSTAQCGAP